MAKGKTSKRPASRPWTACDDAEFDALYRTMSIGELGARLRRSKWALYRRACDIGISMATRGTESLLQAARRLGHGPQWLRPRLDRAGVAHGPSSKAGKGGFLIRLAPADVDRAVRAYAPAKPWSKTT